MSTKLKLILFFVVILVILIVLRLLAGPNQNQASADEITVIDQKTLRLTLTDSLSSADVGSQSIFSLKVRNNSNTDLGSVRLYGYLGFPSSHSGIRQSIFPNWLTPKSLQKYSDQHYFSYIIPLPPKSSASTTLPLKVERLEANQDMLYSQAFVQIIYKQKSWNIFQLNPTTNGPIIASVEDLTSLN